jgi:cation diffusion facilitator CzcD-associated flavoprotein CzcO
MISSAQNFDAVVVGAGFSGLYMLKSLRDRLGLKVRVLRGRWDGRRRLVLELLPRRALRFRSNALNQIDKHLGGLLAAKV